MVLNYIWIAFFVIAFVVAVCKLLFFGDTQIFTEIINSTFDSSKTAFEISLGLTGVLSLWLGVMKMSDRRTIGLNCFRERTVGKLCTGYKFRCSERDQLSGVRQ
jgi:spore maturation protein SpmA